MSLWSFSIEVRIIFTTNELVDIIRISKSNASQNDSEEDSFMKHNVLQARLLKQNAPQARFLDWMLMGSLSYWHGISYIFTNHSSESSPLIDVAFITS